MEPHLSYGAEMALLWRQPSATGTVPHARTHAHTHAPATPSPPRRSFSAAAHHLSATAAASTYSSPELNLSRVSAASGESATNLSASLQLAEAIGEYTRALSASTAQLADPGLRGASHSPVPPSTPLAVLASELESIQAALVADTDALSAALGAARATEPGSDAVDTAAELGISLKEHVARLSRLATRLSSRARSSPARPAHRSPVRSTAADGDLVPGLRRELAASKERIQVLQETLARYQCRPQMAQMKEALLDAANRTQVTSAAHTAELDKLHVQIGALRDAYLDARREVSDLKQRLGTATAAVDAARVRATTAELDVGDLELRIAELRQGSISLLQKAARGQVDSIAAEETSSVAAMLKELYLDATIRIRDLEHQLLTTRATAARRPSLEHQLVDGQLISTAMAQYSLGQAHAAKRKKKRRHRKSHTTDDHDGPPESA
ncbi:uncharacterized protein AMSG_00197 [Thecamonas trahens ATCC 50062]|uniref:Uncharacterized protein n=1 Tax=Thecamonas trahens ATCC 50062 TaxID=461836 RepID=A0A0L0D147_THETB|nr:hypothetical protein AMSG_00197 [Thecamonas trahens ATCC 50062]KNC46079.1 hypothetical protein AMSG_00197 [Thecamonas trahens ATCC 50062]|eukprot:XP_013763059.1 hypothetical protein AMSG_00197 [Thecamonas trahens ATCC 50062]